METKQAMTTIEQLATDNGLTIVVRGIQYARLMLGDTELAVFRGVGWEPAARGWLDGWAQSQREHKLRRIDGCVEVDGQNIKYFWVVPATIASAFRADLDRFVAAYVGEERERGATRGPMESFEKDGGHTADVHGWWWSGNEEEVSQEKEHAARLADMAAIREYLDELERVCTIINDAYDATMAAGKKCFLVRDGTSMGRINSPSKCRYHWIAVHLSAEGRKSTIRLAPRWVHGSGAGKYTISTSDGGKMQAPAGAPASLGCTEITIPGYPGIAGDRGPFDDHETVP